MLKIGDKVLYPLHGAGIIENIIEKDNDGCTKDFFVVSLLNSTMKITVPVDSAESSGMRPIVSSDKISDLLDNFGEAEISEETNWSRRCRNNMDLLKTGDLDIAASVYKDLVKRNNKKSLSAGERKIMLNARQMLCGEIMLALNIPKEDAEEKLTEAAEEKIV